jgi:hypothetical protein
MATITKEQIVQLLETNDKAVIRALLVVYANQTSMEQQLEQTAANNGVGFTGFEGKIGANMAKFAQRTGYLTPKQIAFWRKRDKRGVMKIGKYWKQLQVAAENKARAKGEA